MSGEEQLQVFWDNLPDDIIYLIMDIVKKRLHDRLNSLRHGRLNSQRHIARIARGRRVRLILMRVRTIMGNRPIHNVPLTLQAIIRNSMF